MATPLQFERRMSDAEGLMWRLEKDPHLGSTFANISVLDRPVDFERFRRRVERATWMIPRLRHRVQPGPVALAPPLWVDDPDFDLDYHVRHLALPEPGSMRQLCDLATRIAADPFERTRPLWAFIAVDGLEGGRGALIQKMHHTITDGEGGVRLSLEYLDFERDAPEPPPIDPAELPEPEPVQHVSSGGAVRDMLAGSLRIPIGFARQLSNLATDPGRLPEASAAAAETVRGVVTQLSDTEKARSPLWTARSLRRRLETIRAPFDTTKASAKRLGGSLNTAFLTIAADGAGRYHRELGAPVDELRASMVISTRTAESGANAFTLARLLVPTGAMSIAERFTAIQESAGTARSSAGSASLATLATVAATLPTSLVTRLARQQGETVDFATSNVRGSPTPCYIAGAKLLENYPIGPLAGVAFNLTLLSYAGSLDMGLHLDPAAVTDADLLRTCIEDAVTEFVAVGKRRKR
jgi:WS/DGAT/MGAT family acyltransferase